ncbi:restriction endonuclease subunit S [Priestia koreensis]|uniref:restriction endonuclease subunit S n=1 Tax=Priestia koreensis TaxID=284581 RepID=UPI00203D7BE2|nr:restriction endonuclease subunit S [Priestia koreensis]MCM3006714.1 restriction endonuclease subunit S [Priestia koreensis]
MSKTTKVQKINMEKRTEAVVMIEEEQLYPTPKNWKWVRLKDILEHLQYGYTASSTMNEEGPHYLRITDIQDNQVEWSNVPFCKITEKDLLKYKLYDGDIVVARTGATTGKSFLIFDPPESVFASYLIRLKPSKIIEPKYLWNYMISSSYWDQITVVKKGTAQPGANAQILGDLKVPLAPIDEQQRIIIKLERLFNKVDQARQLIKEVKESFEIRKKMILEKATKGQLGTNYTQEESVLGNIISTKENHIIPQDQQPYEVPDNWLWVNAEYVAKWGSGGTPSRKKEEYYGGNIPWIKTGELNDGIIEDSQETITEKGLKESSAKLFPKGSIVIAMYGATIGKLGVLGMDAATNQACAVGQANDCLNPKYLFYYFLARRGELIALGKGGAQPNISQTVIKQFPFALPPLNEQARIVDRLEKLLLNLENESQLVIEVEEKLNSLKQSILNKAFRGDLGTNDLSEDIEIERLKDFTKSVR